MKKQHSPGFLRVLTSHGKYKTKGKKVFLYDSKHQNGEVEGESHQNQGIMEILHSKEQKEVAQNPSLLRILPTILLRAYQM